MILPPDARAKLWHALLDAFPDSQSLDDLAFAYFPINAESVAPSREPQRIARGFIEWAERTDNLELLLDSALKAADNDGGNQTLTAVAAGIREYIKAQPVVEVPADPYNVCLPRHGTPFVNRAPLRAALQSMVQPAGTPILAVQGDSRSGKSHTALLVSYLANTVKRPDNNPTFYTVSVHLANHEAGFHAGDLAMEFALQLGLSVESIPKRSETQQETRWAGWITSWIVGQLPDVAKRLQCDQIWLVVDGFQQTTVAASTHEVLRRLAAAALQRDNLRVILLDHPDALPDVERSVHRDHTQPATRPDLEHHLQGILQGARLQMDPAILQQIADAIWQEAAPADSPGFMERLDEAIRRRLPILLKR